jgi:hypothetical protein
MTMVPTDESFIPNADDKSGTLVYEVPMPVEGYVIYTQVALDFGEKNTLGIERQTALNLQMAGAIKNGHLRTYDVGVGLPCEPKEATPYVRPDEVKDWLKSIGYPLEWEMDNPGQKGARRRSTLSPAETENLIKRENELRKQGVKNYAQQASEEFNIDPSAARKEKRKYQDSQISAHDPFSRARAKSGKSREHLK